MIFFTMLYIQETVYIMIRGVTKNFSEFTQLHRSHAFSLTLINAQFTVVAEASRVAEPREEPESDGSYRVKVRWVTSESSQPYTKEKIHQLFFKVIIIVFLLRLNLKIPVRYDLTYSFLFQNRNCFFYYW